MLTVGPLRFSFFSADCKEPRHVHVWHDSDNAKFWLDPIKLAFNRGLSRKDLREAERIIGENLDALRSKWDEHCSQSNG